MTAREYQVAPKTRHYLVERDAIMQDRPTHSGHNLFGSDTADNTTVTIIVLLQREDGLLSPFLF